MTRLLIITSVILSIGGSWFLSAHKISKAAVYKVGQPIDSLNGVYVYYNGNVDNVSGRNVTKDKYNLGLKYQCVEFIKRYYYQHLKHKMPDAYGHAKDYFDQTLKDGEKNPKRNLFQYTNGSKAKPKPNDIVVLSASLFNKFGHVAIIAKVTDSEVEVIQQNPGFFSGSRERYDLVFKSGRWTIENDRIFGWLHKV